MTDFKFTEFRAGTGSSIIPEFYYNDNDNTLVVNIEDENGGYDRLYRYMAVPRRVFDEFAAADSKGSFYNTRIKRTYTSEFLGDYVDVEGDKVEKQAAVSPPNRVSLGGRPATETVGSAQAFTPKALGETKVSLSTAAPTKFKVTFTANGNSVEHEVSAEGFDAAAAQVTSLGKALGQEFTVKAVAVSD